MDARRTYLAKMVLNQQAIDIVVGVHRRTLIQGERQHFG